jgi:hypothetical protein
MVALGQGSNEAIAEAYDFGSCSQVVDVGGGHGQLLSAILSRHPHVGGVLFDLPSGIEAARAGEGACCLAPNSQPEAFSTSFPPAQTLMR